MSVTINGILYQNSELSGYALNRIIPYPLNSAQMLELKTAIETNGVFNSVPPNIDYMIPIYGGGSPLPPVILESLDGVLINSRWFAIIDFFKYRYLNFFPVFSYIEPVTKQLYMVWISLTDRTIYIWDSVMQEWYDLLAGVYKGGGTSDFLWGDSSNVLWNDGTNIKEG